MGDDRADVDRLRSYWDGVVHGDVSTPDELNPGAIAIVQQLHGLYQPQQPNPEFRDQLKEALMATAMHPERGPMTLPRMLRSADSVNRDKGGRTLLPIVGSGSSVRVRWALTQFATAALLLLTLAG